MSIETGEDALIGLTHNALEQLSFGAHKRVLQLRKERRIKFVNLANELLEKYPQPLPKDIDCPLLKALTKPVIIQLNGEEIPVHVAKYVREHSGEEGIETNTALVFMHEALKSLVQLFGVAQYTPTAKTRFNHKDIRIYTSHRTLASNTDVENGLNALIFMSEELPFSDSLIKLTNLFNS